MSGMREDTRAGGRTLALGGLLLVVTALSGCAATGLRTLERGRLLYNEAVHETGDQQLLLNLVRLRYRDTPLFLEVASVSTSFEFEASGSASASIVSGPESYGLGLRGRVLEAPTVTYTPLLGEAFVKQLLTPVDPRTILLLSHSGWSIERLLRLLVQRLNDVPNAPSAAGPTPDGAPVYREFLEVARGLRALQRRGALELGAAADTPGELWLRIDADARDDVAWRGAARRLGVAPDLPAYRITTDLGARGPGDIRIVTRALMAALFYVSHGVEAPAEDEAAGRVTVTRTAAGERFDWTGLTGDLLRVRSSKRRPRDAAVALQHEGRWFHVDASDLSSKSTFALLMQLLRLQAGEVPGQAPLLTLPVAR